MAGANDALCWAGLLQREPDECAQLVSFSRKVLSEFGLWASTLPFYQLDVVNLRVAHQPQADAPEILPWKKNLTSIILDPEHTITSEEAEHFLNTVDGFLWSGGLENELHSILFECRLVALDLVEMMTRRRNNDDPQLPA